MDTEFNPALLSVFKSSHENVREVFLESICIMSNSSTSFILKMGEEGSTVVRSTLPSLMGKVIDNSLIPLDLKTFSHTNGNLEGWMVLPPVSEGRMKSILGCKFSFGSEHYVACAGDSKDEAFDGDTVNKFSEISHAGEHTIMLIRQEQERQEQITQYSDRVKRLQTQITNASVTTEQLEGANAQLSNALLEVSSAKAQSKALLITVGIGIFLFAISEFQIEPWLEASGVSDRALVYQKILILGGLIPVQVVVERFITSKVNSNASQIRIGMYEEVLSVLLEDGALTKKELRWLELYRRQQGITREEAQLVEATLRSKLLHNSRKIIQTDVAASAA